MKESRLIMITLAVIFIVLIFLLFILHMCGIEGNLCINIVINLECGVVVGFITTTCQYLASRRRIINSVYGKYFDIYKSYYYSMNQSFLWHYNVYSVYKKMEELNPKIVEALDEYHGLFKEKDNTYKKLNPTIKLEESYKAKIMKKILFSWFNKKYFINFFKPLMKEIEDILKNINKERFEKDKSEMIRLYNFMWNVKN